MPALSCRLGGMMGMRSGARPEHGGTVRFITDATEEGSSPEGGYLLDGRAPRFSVPRALVRDAGRSRL